MSTPSATVSPLDAGEVRSEVLDGVATVDFHHPKGNSLPGALLRGLTDQITALSTNPDARVIVLRSQAPGPFCAGASFDELRSIGDAATGREFFMGFARLILAMRSCPKFILTRAHGRTVGGGVGIVAASDYVVAHVDAAVRLSELAVGIGPFVVGPVIERKIGLAAFQALAIDATEWRDSSWAERVGLFAHVAPSVEEMDAVVANLAARLAHSNPQAMARMKQVFWQGTEHWDQLLAERAEMSGTLVLSDFTRAAIAAFGAR
jgi:methylglutaconyl-CoA hydratase